MNHRGESLFVGLWTSGLTYFGALFALESAVVVQLIVVCLSGLFGLGSALAVAYFRHWLEQRAKDREAQRIEAVRPKAGLF